MLLSLNDKRIIAIKNAIGIVGQNDSGYVLFRLEKLPLGYKAIQLISLKSNRMTPDELRIAVNSWLKKANENSIAKWLKATKLNKLPKCLREEFSWIMKPFVVSTIYGRIEPESSVKLSRGLFGIIGHEIGKHAVKRITAQPGSLSLYGDERKIKIVKRIYAYDANDAIENGAREMFVETKNIKLIESD
jgi:hypothetical protein